MNYDASFVVLTHKNINRDKTGERKGERERKCLCVREREYPPGPETHT